MRRASKAADAGNYCDAATSSVSHSWQHQITQPEVASYVRVDDFGKSIVGQSRHRPIVRINSSVAYQRVNLAAFSLCLRYKRLYVLALPNMTRYSRRL